MYIHKTIAQLLSNGFENLRFGIPSTYQNFAVAENWGKITKKTI